MDQNDEAQWITMIKHNGRQKPNTFFAGTLVNGEVY